MDKDETCPLITTTPTTPTTAKSKSCRKYSKLNDAYCQYIWTLFCEIHDLPFSTTKYEEIEPEIRLHGQANLVWMTFAIF